MNDTPDPLRDAVPSAPPASAAALPPGPSLVRLAVTGLVVLLLVVGGVMVGAWLWPNVTTVERRVVAPIRAAAPAPTPQEQLPDLLDDACPAIVRLLTTPPAATVIPPPPPPAAPRRGRHARRHAAPVAPVPAPAMPLDGVLVSADGYLVTSAQRLAAAPGPVTALLADGRRLAAAPVASDPLSGLALLKVDATDLPDLPFLRFADDGLSRVGSWGFVPSTADGTGCSVRTGIVASDSFGDAAPLRTYLRVGAGTAPDDGPRGMGAPFLDASGRMLGIAVAAAAGETADGGLLLPAPIAAQVTDAMIRNGKAPPSPFGLFAADLDPALARRLGAERLRGAVVLLILPDGPADHAGLRAGDVVLSAGGTPVSGASELARALDPDAASIALDVSRRGEHVAITLTP